MFQKVTLLSYILCILSFSLLMPKNLYAVVPLVLTDEEKLWIKQQPTIKVAIDPNQHPIEFMHENNPRGIGWEYLNYISEKTGLKFKGVAIKNVNDSVNALKRGEVDLISSIYSEYEFKDLSYSSPYFYSLFALFLRKDETADFSIMYLKLKRFSYLPDYQYHEDIKQIYNDSDMDFIKTSSALEALQMIRDYKSDITVLPRVVAMYLLKTRHMNSIEMIDVGTKAKPVVFAGDKNNSKLIAIINKVLASIPRPERFNMRKKWTHDLLNHSPELTNELSAKELKYLRAHSIIRYSGDPSWLPYEAFNKKGKYIGIVAEYIRELEERLNIKFIKIPTKSWEESVNLLKTGEIDILSETAESSLKDKFLMSNSYLSNPIGIIMNKEHDYIRGIIDIEDKKIAVVKGYGYVADIENNFPQIEFIYVKNTEQGLKKVSNGKIDAFIASYATADYQINKFGLDNIRVIGSTQFQINLAFAISPKLSSFKPILNKAIGQMTVLDREKIIKKWIKNNNVVRVDYTIAWITLAFSLLILGILIVINTRSRKENIRRRQMQNQLETLNNRFEAIANNIHGMIYESTLNHDGSSKALYLSSGCKKLFGIEVEDAMDNFDSLFAQVVKKDLLSLRDLIEKAAISHSIQNWKGRIKVNGKTKWLYNSFIAHKNKQGDIYFDGFVIDISKEKETEFALIKEKEKAETATKAKSDFLSNMSHEIRTPMNAIIGMSYLALKSELNHKQRNYIQKVYASGELLLGILNDILDFSKIESGKLDLEHINFQLEEVFENLENLISLNAQEKNIKLTFDLPENLPTALIGDPLRLGQILINLGNNATKFTEQGEIIFQVIVLEEHNAEVKLHFLVKDTGVGITQEHQDKLFQAFSQADTSTTRKYGGTGLGLSISKKLTHLLKGDIWVDSVVGKGSTFHFTACFTKQLSNQKANHQSNHQSNQQGITSKYTLNAKGVAAGSTTNSLEKLEPLQSSLDKLKGARILLVEDNEVNQELAIELLISNGISVKAVNNGQQALDTLKNEEFDGILMDCQMPVMDGYEATRLIRLDESYKDLPILAMTANAMQGDKEKVLEIGMNAHIAKPIKVKEMFTTMEKWITPSNPEREIETSSINISEKTVSGKIESNSELFLKLKGIDVSAGLETCQGNQNLYLKLLNKFKTNEVKAIEKIQNSLNNSEKGDEPCSHYAHSLRGVAGNIGALEVQKTAQKLEDACTQQTSKTESSPLIKQLIKQLDTELQIVLIGLESLERTPQAIHRNQPMDIKQLKLLLQQLRTLLYDNDTDAADTVEELLKLPGIKAYKTDFKKLLKAIDGYEFVDALHELDKLEPKI